ncbi:hypothetical protein OIU76_005507 [Salix suchowensis]|nr:hypothetical protein OIU76_005507 [Salix suchowensis]
MRYCILSWRLNLEAPHKLVFHPIETFPVMGISAGEHSLLVSFKGMVQGNEETVDKSNETLWRKVLEGQARRGSQPRKQNDGRHAESKRPRRVSMKRAARVQGSARRVGYGVGRRVRTLKKLIPNGGSLGLDGLFRETADYILTLQMRVQVMQIMVKELTGSDES